MPAAARVSFAEIVTDKGHDAFLLEEPELFAIVRGFLDGAAQGARPCSGGCEVNDAVPRRSAICTMAEAARAPGGARVDLLLVAEMVEPRRARCSTSAAATANCCGCWRDSAASTAAASSCRARASTNASPRASR